MLQPPNSERVELVSDIFSRSTPSELGQRNYRHFPRIVIRGYSSSTTSWLL